MNSSFFTFKYERALNCELFAFFWHTYQHWPTADRAAIQLSAVLTLIQQSIWE